ncbi:MAG: IS66 family insertion sequence element accessory protein TnpB [Lachnospiraceae bacterium]
MLEDAAAIRKVVIACGYVDLRKGIDGLSMIIGDRYRQNPFEKGTLFLFCGRRSDRIKGLLWMGNGFLLLYKRLESGSLSWPRTSEEAAELDRGAVPVSDAGIESTKSEDQRCHSPKARLIFVQKAEISRSVFWLFRSDRKALNPLKKRL